ncbi:hypothetical protein PPYR_01547 [Photinus pyralis]|uniref:DDE Tnp4 domain-containing protein n=1 Tax=Photinus pyralis TaxID=7054 RepID=A0A5N4B4N4_PHOPY|nr:hypothetical protein PPYR_01547 [Photinus pyralis]
MDKLEDIALGVACYFIQDLFFEDDKENTISSSIQKVNNYIEETVYFMQDSQFKADFRLSRVTFETLLSNIGGMWTENVRRGAISVKIEKQLMIAIWYLANLECFRSVAERFGVSKSSAWKCLHCVCEKLIEYNKTAKVLAWPNVQSQERISRMFYKKANFPSCIDGSHVPIKAPLHNHTSYVNRKGFHSVILQAICDDKYLFTDVYAGEAGSVHDAMVFKRSEFSVNENAYEFLHNGHILGDSAYPLTSKLLVPFKDYGQLTEVQKHYNTAHAKTRVPIEQAFALLKGRFRRLKLVENTRIDRIPIMVVSACILHNICMLNKDILDINIQSEQNEEREMTINYAAESVTQAGKNKREIIAHNMTRAFDLLVHCN